MRSSLAVGVVLLAAAAAAAKLPLQTLSSSSSSEESENGELWALLAAGSNGWWNYRHQADVAHAYQVLRAHGVPADHIVVMMYDDIANDKSNPYPGKLFNSPAKKDVYAGLKIDYRGAAVTPKNFLAVLQGKADEVDGGNGRVIQSGPDDRIFVFFTDHGAPGMICFPNEILTTKSLNDALLSMHKNSRYEKLVFYLEACESGSMFEKVLPANINVYAVSAANAKESSYGTYCENPLKLPCLGDLFSTNWMEDSDVEDLAAETIGAQFKLVQKETASKSHVCKFGDLDLEPDHVSLYQGGDKAKRLFGDGFNRSSERLRTAVESRDVELYHLRIELEQTNDLEAGKSLNARIQHILEDRAQSRRRMKALVHAAYDRPDEGHASNAARRKRFFETREAILYPACHHAILHAYNALCESFTEHPYAAKYAYVLNNMCIEEGGDAAPIIDLIDQVCV